jgi:hypothetical protein
MAVGHSDEVDPGDAVAIVIDQCRAALGAARAQAGILFSAYDSFDPSVMAAIGAAFPGVSVAGCTSSAEMSSVDGFHEDSIALALFASDTVDFTTGIGTGLGRDVEAACRSAVSQALAGTQREPRVCIVLTEIYLVDPQLTLEAISRALPNGVAVVGGGSSRRDLVTVSPTYQFRDSVVAQDGVAVLLLSGPVAFSASVGTGWRAIGATGTVTRSTYGRLDEIDGRPALEFVDRYLGGTGRATYGNMLAVIEADTNRSYLRGMLGSDPTDGSLKVGGWVPAGATVQLTTTDADDLAAGAQAALAQLAEEFPAGATPEAVLVFSCAVRKYLLGSKTPVEAEMVSAALGRSIPMAGMYTYGEIGPMNEAASSRFHNETMVTLLLGT